MKENLSYLPSFRSQSDFEWVFPSMSISRDRFSFAIGALVEVASISHSLV